MQHSCTLQIWASKRKVRSLQKHWYIPSMMYTKPACKSLHCNTAECLRFLTITLTHFTPQYDFWSILRNYTAAIQQVTWENLYHSFQCLCMYGKSYFCLSYTIPTLQTSKTTSSSCLKDPIWFFFNEKTSVTKICFMTLINFSSWSVYSCPCRWWWWLLEYLRLYQIW